MSKILLLGAGRSVFSLALYLKNHALELNLSLRVGDLLMSNAKKVADLVPNSTYFQFDITADKPLETHDVDLVISMLPAHLHGKVAQSCLESSTHLITASYLNPQIESLHLEAKKKGIQFIMECGLDPGIDHMSAMTLIDKIKSQGGEISSFASYTGGLIAPESDDNPWGYKFSWNPRNVVLAGQGVVKFKFNNALKYIPYSSVFKRTEEVCIPHIGTYEAYANRNSLHYLDAYKLSNCPSVFRGTLRNIGFCEAWDFLITLGLTNDSFAIRNCKGMTYRNFLDSFLPYSTLTVEEKIDNLLNTKNKSNVFEKLNWLGLFSETKITLDNASPAQILQQILELKWKLKPEDKDMVLMVHRIEFETKNKKYSTISYCKLIGENSKNTAMAKTVGIPVGIATKLLLQKKIKTKGILIPTLPELYTPILEELKKYGVVFMTETTEIV